MIPKPDHVMLMNLVGHLREGHYVIPDFQREFEWKPGDIQELMRSIFLDYYIGSLLLWEGEKASFDALSCEPLRGFSGNSKQKHIVLDGQQRLTAMYYAFMTPDKHLPNKSNKFLYFIRADLFVKENYDEAFEYDWTKKGKKILEDQEEQFKKHLFPLKIVGDGVFALSNWLQDYEKYWRKQQKDKEKDGDRNGANIAHENAKNAEEFKTKAMGILENYSVSFIELEGNLKIEKICDIFTRINSRGAKLDIFDLMNAVLKPKGLQLKHLYREAAPRLNFVDTTSMNVYILQVMSILCQAYSSAKYLYYLCPGHEKKVRDDTGSRKEILIKDDTEFKKKWGEAVEILEESINALRHEFGVVEPKYLPYASILPVFSALRYAAKKIPPGKRLAASEKIRVWYWASILGKRYSSAVESTAARDYQDIASWFENDRSVPQIVEDFREKFRNIDLSTETSQNSTYIGIFNLLVLQKARDWISGSATQYGDLDDHHIVPQSWAEANDCKNLADSILNRTLLTADSNRKIIRDKLPNEYLREMFAGGREADARKILETHLISGDAVAILLEKPFTEKHLKRFLDARLSTVLDAIKKTCITA